MRFELVTGRKVAGCLHLVCFWIDLIAKQDLGHDMDGGHMRSSHSLLVPLSLLQTHLLLGSGVDS